MVAVVANHEHLKKIVAITKEMFKIEIFCFIVFLLNTVDAIIKEGKNVFLDLKSWCCISVIWPLEY